MLSLTTATHLDCLMTENLSKKLTVEMVVEDWAEGEENSQVTIKPRREK